MDDDAVWIVHRKKPCPVEIETGVELAHPGTARSTVLSRRGGTLHCSFGHPRLHLINVIEATLKLELWM